MPLRKSQLRSGPTDFSHTKDRPCSCTALPHLGQEPSAGCPEKSTGSALASSSSRDWPKSNSSLCSSEIFRMAAKGLPSRLRKPCSGPRVRCESRISASATSSWRLPGILVMEKSQRVQAKRL